MKNKLIALFATLMLLALTAGAQTVKRLPVTSALDFNANYVIEFDYADLAALDSSSTNVTVNLFPNPGATNTFSEGMVLSHAYYDLRAFRNTNSAYTNLLVTVGDTGDADRIFTAFQANAGDTNRAFFVNASTLPFAYTNAARLTLAVQATNATAAWSTYTSGVLRVYLQMTPRPITSQR